jgi:hypothetical protein
VNLLFQLEKYRLNVNIVQYIDMSDMSEAQSQVDVSLMKYSPEKAWHLETNLKFWDHASFEVSWHWRIIDKSAGEQVPVKLLEHILLSDILKDNHHVVQDTL